MEAGKLAALSPRRKSLSLSTTPSTWNELEQDIIEANQLVNKYMENEHLHFHLFPKKLKDIPFTSLWKFFVGIYITKTDFTRPPKMLNLKQFYRVFLQIKESAALLDNNHHEKNQPGFMDDMLEPSDNECTICMEKMAEVVLPCTHAFCNNCLGGWQKKSNTCPMCRKNLDSTGEEDWVLTGSGVDEDEVVAYLSSCLGRFSK